MSIDPLAEEILSFAAAARRIPRIRNNRPVSPSTIWRWATDGVRNVRLETTQIGGTRCTSMEALRRFFARLNGEPAPAALPPSAPAVERQLDAIGI
jgi:hypothetical protein